MLPDIISKLVDNLPESSQLYLGSDYSGSKGSTDLRLHRRSKASMDPRFPWAYVMDHIRRDEPLPAIVDLYDLEYLTDAYCFQEGFVENDDLMRAMMWLQPEFDNFRGCLEACLLLRDTSLEQIAEHFRINIDSLRLYERLFYSVRDRLDDVTFFGPQHVPHTHAALQDDSYWRYASAATIMKHAAVTLGGGMENALLVFGATDLPSMPTSQMMELFRSMSLRAALVAAATGGHYRARNPVMSMMRGLLIAQESNPNLNKPQDDSRVGVYSIGPAEAILITKRGCQDNSEYEKQAAMIEMQERDLNAAIGRQPKRVEGKVIS